MEKLTQTEREFLRSYFNKVSSIWSEYFYGKSTMAMFRMSVNKREILLDEFRVELNRIRRKIK